MSSLSQQVGKQVTVRGEADNASGGAIVVTDDNTPVYLDGIDSWDKATRGKQVSVTGILREIGGQATVNAAGEQLHGYASARLVIENPTHTVV